MPYVLSTLSNDQSYTLWNKPDLSGARVGRSVSKLAQVLVKGGANVANRLTTPEGVVTEITDEQAELLAENSVFKTHLKNGFVRIITSEPVDANKAVKEDLKDRDTSAPLNPNKGDFENGGRAAGVAPLNVKTIQ